MQSHTLIKVEQKLCWKHATLLDWSQNYIFFFRCIFEVDLLEHGLESSALGRSQKQVSGMFQCLSYNAVKTSIQRKQQGSEKFWHVSEFDPRHHGLHSEVRGAVSAFVLFKKSFGGNFENKYMHWSFYRWKILNIVASRKWIDN